MEAFLWFIKYSVISFHCTYFPCRQTNGQPRFFVSIPHIMVRQKIQRDFSPSVSHCEYYFTAAVQREHTHILHAAFHTAQRACRARFAWQRWFIFAGYMCHTRRLNNGCDQDILSKASKRELFSLCDACWRVLYCERVRMWIADSKKKYRQRMRTDDWKRGIFRLILIRVWLRACKWPRPPSRIHTGAYTPSKSAKNVVCAWCWSVGMVLFKFDAGRGQ